MLNGLFASLLDVLPLVRDAMRCDAMHTQLVQNVRDFLYNLKGPRYDRSTLVVVDAVYICVRRILQVKWR